MKKIFWFPALAVASLLAAGGALAHDDAHLDTQQAPHGGQLRMAGVYHFELVLDHSSPEPKDKPVLVYLTDHAGQKISAACAAGTATMLSGKTRATVALTPDGDNLRLHPRTQGRGVGHTGWQGTRAGALHAAGRRREVDKGLPEAENMSENSL